MVFALLAWTAIDLLAPQLCDAETETIPTEASSSTSMPAPPSVPIDDCFCCSQTVDPVSLDLAHTEGEPIALPPTPDERPSPGVAPLLYHPPLSV